MGDSLTTDPSLDKNNPKNTSFQSSWVKDKRAWLIWACAAFFYYYEYILRIAPSVMTEELMYDFKITSSVLGSMVALYYYAYVALQIPGGFIVDLIGPRRIIAISSLLCAAGTLIFVYSPPYLFWAQVGRFMVGMGSACAFISCLKIASVWFHPTKFSVISGLTTMTGTIGGFCAKPLAYFINSYGWRDCLLWLGISGFLFAILFWIVIRDTPHNSTSTKTLDEDSLKIHKPTKKGAPSLAKGLKKVSSCPQTWLIALFGGLMYIPISAVAELWGNPYLMQLYQIDNEQAATMIAFIFIGFAFGSPTAGWLSEKFKSRKVVMSYSAIGAIITFMIVVWVPKIPYYFMLVLLFYIGFFKGGQMLNFVSAKEIHHPRYSGITIGFANGIVMLSGAIFQPALGFMLDMTWNGQVSASGTPVYSIFSYQVAMSSVIICLIISWIIIKFYVKETYNNS